MSAYFFFFFNHSKIATEHRWHRFLPSGTIWLREILLIFLLVLPAHLLLISCAALLSESLLPGHFSGFINNLRQHSQCSSASIFLSPRLSSSYFDCLPLPQCSSSLCFSLYLFFFHPLTVFVADSSAPQEHWGEQRKQRFGSVVLILIFCRLDGRLGGAFIHTLHNHFHCNCKPWLQTTGVVAISTNVPSVTRRLHVFYLKQWLVGEHGVLSLGPGEMDVKCRMGKRVKQTHHNRETGH